MERRNEEFQENRNSEFQDKQSRISRKAKQNFKDHLKKRRANLGIKSRTFLPVQPYHHHPVALAHQRNKNQVIYQRSFSESLMEATTETHWTALEFFLHFCSQHHSFLASYCASSKVSPPFSPFQPLPQGSEAPYFSITACIDRASYERHWEAKQNQQKYMGLSKNYREITFSVVAEAQ